MATISVTGRSCETGYGLRNKPATSDHDTFSFLFLLQLQIAINNHNNISREKDNKTYHWPDIHDKEIDLSFLLQQPVGLYYCPESMNLKPFKRMKPKVFAVD